MPLRMCLYPGEKKGNMTVGPEKAQDANMGEQEPGER